MSHRYLRAATCADYERKGRFVFQFEYDSMGRIFQDKRSISRFRFLYCHRLVRIAYACFFAGRSVAVAVADASRIFVDTSVWLDDTSVQ